MDWSSIGNGLGYAFVGYTVLLNLVYFFLMVTSFVALRSSWRFRLQPSERPALMSSGLAPGVSILAPAFNEQATIVQSVRAMASLNYPDYEVIVINDGSVDNTLQALIDEFQLYRSARVPAARVPTKPIRAIYESRGAVPLIVVDKENGGKSDALNAGLNLSYKEFVAAVDSDSLLEPSALLEVVSAAMAEKNCVAVGGTIRVVNGCQVKNGRILNVQLPASLLARFQVLEYLRAFLIGRVGCSTLNALLLISGAFGLFRRELVVRTGGFLGTTVGEDMELVVRLHHVCRENGEDAKIAFVPEAICWTEVPEKLKTLHRQRNRWQRGTVECMTEHRAMALRPKFGAVGMFGFPYFILFEMFGPAVEVAGYLWFSIALLFGAVSMSFALTFFAASMVGGITLSMAAVLFREYIRHEDSPVSEVFRLLWLAILENFGFRQLLAVWRAKGLIDGLRKRTGWGVMDRKGFEVPPDDASRYAPSTP